MTKDLANIAEGKRALDDIRSDREKLQRMMNQLADYKAKDEIEESTNMQLALLYSQRMQTGIQDLIQMEEIMKKHVENMESMDKKSGKL